jgi:hypothetical protein
MSIDDNFDKLALILQEYQSEESVEKFISNIRGRFTMSSSGNTLVESSSLAGTKVSLFNKLSHKTDIAQRVDDTARRILLETTPETDNFKKLSQENTRKLSHLQARLLPSDDTPFPALASFLPEVASTQEERSTFIARNSLLSNVVVNPRHSPLVSDSLMGYVFQKSNVLNNVKSQFINLIARFSTRYSPNNFDKVHSSMKPLLAGERRQELTKDASLLGRSPNDRPAARRKVNLVVKNIISDVHNSKTSRDNTYINIRPKGSLRPLKLLIEKAIGKELPPYLKSYFENGSAKDLTNTVLKELTNKARLNILPSSCKRIIENVFLNGVWKQLPEKVRKVEFFKRYVEPFLPEIIRKGICEQVLDFLPIEHQDVIVNRLTKRTLEVGFEKAFEEVLSTLIEEGLTEVIETLQQGLEAKCDNLPFLIKSALSASGINSSIHQIRLEIQPTEGDFYNLRFFSNSFKDGCYSIETIHIEDLNEDFFQHFLHLETSTYWNSSTNYQEKHFVEGFLNKYSSAVNRTSVKDKIPSNDFQDFAFHILQEKVEGFSSKDVFYLKIDQLINYFNKVVSSDPSKAKEAFTHLNTLKQLSSEFLENSLKEHEELSGDEKIINQRSLQIEHDTITATLMDLEDKLLAIDSSVDNGITKSFNDLLAHSSNISPSYIKTIKDTLVTVFGEESSEVIDEITASLLPSGQSIQDAKDVSYSVKSLMTSIASNIKGSSYTTALYTAGSFALISAVKETPLGSTSLGISFVMGLLARNHYEVIAALLPKKAKETYDYIYNSAKKVILRETLNLLANLFSSKEELQKLRQKAKDELDLESDWDFSLPPKEIPPIDFDIIPLDATPSTLEEIPSSIPTSFTPLPTGSILLEDSLSMSSIGLLFEELPHPDELEGLDVGEFAQNYIRHQQIINELMEFSIHEIEAIQDKKEAFKKLNEIQQSIHLLTNIVSRYSREVNTSYKTNNQITASLLNGLAACNILAKKCFPDLEETQLTPPQALQFINKKNDNSSVQQHAIELCEHFGIDYKKEYSQEELSQLKQEYFFNGSPSTNLDNCDFISGSIDINVTSLLPEYFATKSKPELLLEKTIQESDNEAKKLVNYWVNKQLIIENHSSTFTPESSPLLREWESLSLQEMLKKISKKDKIEYLKCSYERRISTRIKSSNYTFYKIYESAEEDYNPSFLLLKDIHTKVRDSIEVLSLSYNTPIRLNSLEKASTFYKNHAQTTVENSLYKANGSNAITPDTKEKLKTIPFHCDNKDFLLLIKKQDISQLIDFFSKNFQALINNEASREYFNLFLFRVGTLKGNLEKHPEIALRLANFYNIAIDHSLEHFISNPDKKSSYLSTLLFLFESSIYAKNIIETCTEVSTETFPKLLGFISNKLSLFEDDINLANYDYIKSVLDHEENDSIIETSLRDFFDLLWLEYANIKNPEDLNEEQRSQIAETLYLALSFGNLKPFLADSENFDEGYSLETSRAYNVKNLEEYKNKKKILAQEAILVFERWKPFIKKFNGLEKITPQESQPLPPPVEEPLLLQEETSSLPVVESPIPARPLPYNPWTPINDLSHNLSRLRRFCPLKNINVFSFEDAIKTISFVRENITFNIKTAPNGKAKAHLSTDPDFSISSSQKHSSLKGFTNTLILEDSAGRKKALWRCENKLEAFSLQLFKSGAFSFLPPSIAKIAESYIINNPLTKSDGSTLFTLELNEDGSISCEEPEAMFYLFLTYLAQGNTDKIRSTFNELRRVGSVQAFNSDLLSFNNFLPFLLLPIFPLETRAFIIKLIALLEENRTFQAEEEFSCKDPIHSFKSTPKDNTIKEDCAFLGIRSVLLQSALMEFEKHSERRYFTGSEELFVLKNLIKTHETLIMTALPTDKIKQSPIYKYIESKINIEATVDYPSKVIKRLMTCKLSMEPNLLNRYCLLSKEYNSESTYFLSWFTSPESTVLDRFSSNLRNGFGYLDTDSSFEALAENILSAPESIINLPTKEDTLSDSFISLIHNSPINSTLISGLTEQALKSAKDLPFLLKDSKDYPPTQIQLFDFTDLKKHFFSYYLIARGENPFPQNEALFKVKRLEFVTMLKQLDGQHSKGDNLLIAVLKSVAFSPVKSTYPSLMKLIKLLTNPSQRLFDFMGNLEPYDDFFSLYEELFNSNHGVFELHKEVIDLFLEKNEPIPSLENEEDYPPTQLSEFGPIDSLDLSYLKSNFFTYYMIINYEPNKLSFSRERKALLLEKRTQFLATIELLKTRCDHSPELVDFKSKFLISIFYNLKSKSSGDTGTIPNKPPFPSFLHTQTYLNKESVKNFLNSICNRTLCNNIVTSSKPLKMATSAAIMTVKKTTKIAIATALLATHPYVTSARNAIPLLRATEATIGNIASTVSSSVRGILFTPQEVVIPNIPLCAERVELLSEQSRLLENLRTNSRVEFFDETPSTNPNPLVRVEDVRQTFAVPNADSSFQKIIDGLHAYRNAPNSPRIHYCLKDGKHLHSLHSNLDRNINDLSTHLEKEKNKILHLLFNEEKSLHIFSGDNETNFLQAIRLFLYEDHNSLKTTYNLSAEEIHSFENTMYCYLIAATEKQQLEKAFSYLEYIYLNPNIDEDKKSTLINQTGQALLEKRSYEFNLESSRLLKAFLVFELMQKTLLWKGQALRLSQLLLSPEKRKILELIMGSGKTYFGRPASSIFLADGNNLVFNFWPEALATSNIEQISKNSGGTFGQRVYKKSITRASMQLLENYQALAHVFKTVIEERSQINATKADAQSLEMNFIEMIYKICSPLKTYEKDIEDKILSCQTSLRLLRDHGVANIDEVHDALKSSQERRHPLNQGVKLDNTKIQTIHVFMSILFKTPEIKEILNIGSQTNEVLEEDEYQRALPHLAQHIVQTPFFGTYTPQQTQEITSYLCDEQELPTWIESGAAKDRIILAHGILTKVLFKRLQSIPFVDSGPTKDYVEGKEYPVVYQGNNNPQESTVILNPEESLIASYLIYYNTPIHGIQVNRLLQFLEEKANLQTQGSSFSPDETPFGRIFFSCTGLTFKEYKDIPTREKINLFSRLRVNLNVKMLYNKFIISKQIKLFDKGVKTTSINFSSMFNQTIGDTGSAHNQGSLPIGSHVLKAPETLGESVDFLFRNCSSDDSIHSLPSKSPQEHLTSIIDSFCSNPDYCAVTDCGALFRGIPNSEVARQILNSNEDIKGVAFYDKDNNKVILEKRNSGAERRFVTVALDSSKVPVDQRWTYYDNSHIMSADVKQKRNGKAVLTVGEKTFFESELVQGMWRMRGLKELEQGISIVFPESIRSSIDEDGTGITIQKIVAFTNRNESISSAQENFTADLNKIKDVGRRAALDKILAATNIYEIKHLFKVFEPFLIYKIETDLYKKYGRANKPTRTQIIVDQEKRNTLQMLRNTGEFSRKQMDKFDETLKSIPNGCYLEYTKVSFSQDNMTIHINDQEDTQVLSLDQSQETQAETDTQQNLQVESNAPTVRIDYDHTRLPWGKESSFAALANLNQYTTSNREVLPFSLFSKPATCRFFSMSDSLDSFSDLLPDNFFVSENLLPANLEPLTAYQKPFYNLLVIQRGNNPQHVKNPVVIAIDQTESAAIRKQIKELKENPYGLKIGVFSTLGNSFVEGTENLLDFKRDLFGNTSLKEISTLCQLFNRKENLDSNDVIKVLFQIPFQNFEQIKLSLASLYEAKKPGFFKESGLERCFDIVESHHQATVDARSSAFA